MQIIEDFIPVDYQNEILDIITTNDFPWFMNDNQSGYERPNSIDNGTVPDYPYGFSHTMFWKDGPLKSPYYSLIEPLLNRVADFVQSDIALLRVRAALLTNINMHGLCDPHVDNLQTPHTTLLYYPMSSDSPTVFYKERYDPNVEAPVDFHVADTVMPRKGSALMFDGWTFHSSSYPVNEPKRIVLNINFVKGVGA
jgi:hypothetical protein